jgi:hypothetical protein
VLWNPTTPSQVPGLQSVKDAGEKLGLTLYIVSAVTAAEFDPALASMARECRWCFRGAVPPTT